MRSEDDLSWDSICGKCIPVLIGVCLGALFSLYFFF